MTEGPRAAIDVLTEAYRTRKFRVRLLVILENAKPGELTHFLMECEQKMYEDEWLKQAICICSQVSPRLASEVIL